MPCFTFHCNEGLSSIKNPAKRFLPETDLFREVILLCRPSVRSSSFHCISFLQYLFYPNIFCPRTRAQREALRENDIFLSSGWRPIYQNVCSECFFWSTLPALVHDFYSAGAEFIRHVTRTMPIINLVFFLHLSIWSLSLHILGFIENSSCRIFYSSEHKNI